MSDAGAKRAWVLRTLGIDVAEMEPEASVPAGKLTPIWIEAKERVDAQVATLQSALRARRHPTLDRIAEFGLFGIADRANGGLMVQVMAGLREVDAAGADAPARRKALGAVERLQAYLDSDKRIALIENNAFGVPVELSSTLGGALAKIGRALAA